jgi:hypothetical protein
MPLQPISQSRPWFIGHLDTKSSQDHFSGSANAPAIGSNQKSKTNDAGGRVCASKGRPNSAFSRCRHLKPFVSGDGSVFQSNFPRSIPALGMESHSPHFSNPGVGHDWHWSHSHFWRSNDHRRRSRDFGGRSGSSWRFSDGHSEGDRKSGLLRYRSHFEADGFWFQDIQCGPRFSDDGSRCFGTGYRLNFVNFPLASRARSRGFPAQQRRRAMLIWRRVSAA